MMIAPLFFVILSPAALDCKADTFCRENRLTVSLKIFNNIILSKLDIIHHVVLSLNKERTVKKKILALVLLFALADVSVLYAYSIKETEKKVKTILADKKNYTVRKETLEEGAKAEILYDGEIIKEIVVKYRSSDGLSKEGYYYYYDNEELIALQVSEMYDNAPIDTEEYESSKSSTSISIWYFDKGKAVLKSPGKASRIRATPEGMYKRGMELFWRFSRSVG